MPEARLSASKPLEENPGCYGDVEGLDLAVEEGGDLAGGDG